MTTPSTAAAIEPLLLPIDQAVRFSGLSRSRIYVKIAAGELVARKVGRRTLLETSSLRAMIENLPRAEIRAPRERRRVKPPAEMIPTGG